MRSIGRAFVLALMLWPVRGNTCAIVPPSQERPDKSAAVAIDINKATADDFAKLPGIGPALAKQIVAYREKHGPFRRVEDLMALKGIGFKKWKAIKPYVRVGESK